jgi:hypothetical protein
VIRRMRGDKGMEEGKRRKVGVWMSRVRVRVYLGPRMDKGRGVWRLGGDGFICVMNSL